MQFVPQNILRIADEVEVQLHNIKKLNSVAFSPLANYTDRATAACRRS
jgi:hypothetical protein